MFHESDKEVKMTCKFQYRFYTPKRVFSIIESTILSENGFAGQPPPCRPGPGASSSAWSVCCMARAGTAAAGSGGVTGATGAAVWGAAGAQAPGIGPANGVDFLSKPFLLGVKGGFIGIHTCCIHYRPSIGMIQSI